MNAVKIVFRHTSCVVNFATTRRRVIPAVPLFVLTHIIRAGITAHVAAREYFSTNFPPDGEKSGNRKFSPLYRMTIS
jgi:hypothetical protein